MPKPLYKITASLLNSWNYMFHCDEEYSANAYDSFIKTLNREKSPPNIYMMRGIEFEDKCVKGEVEFISEIIKDGAFQVYGEKYYTVQNLEIKVLGYIDVLKEGVVYDIKRTTKFEVQKYFNTFQHHIYLDFVPEAYKFVYLIASGYNDDYITINTEEYDRTEIRDVDDIIEEFFGWLQENNLFETYKNIWKIGEK